MPEDRARRDLEPIADAGAERVAWGELQRAPHEVVPGIERHGDLAARQPDTLTVGARQREDRVQVAVERQAQGPVRGVLAAWPGL